MEEKKLFLSTKDKKIAGVCGGLGEYFNIDSTIVRIIFIALLLFTAVLPVLIGYVVCACVIPSNPLEM